MGSGSLLDQYVPLMYGLCDCNNFYASCERVFNPSLNGHPIVVLSNNDGCVIARSNEAKQLGIRMGQPFFELRDLIRYNRVRAFSSNFVLYGDMSRRVMTILKRHVPTEIYSIDEAFLDLRDIPKNQLDSFGHRLSYTVRRSTGIPVSIGIAPTKTLAKIASKLCKQYPKLKGCCYMHRPEDIEKVLRKFPIEDVWGIGRRHSKMLASFHIRTAYEFTQMPQEWVHRQMSIVGLRTWKELQGVSCIGFEQMPPEKQQIATTRTFAHNITDPDELHECVAQYASACAAKLRQQQSLCSQLQLFIRTNPHRDDLPQQYESRLVKLPHPTDSTLELAAQAAQLLREIYRPGFEYKRAGVILSDISPRKGMQQELFGNGNREKHDKLMNVLDKLNDTYGKHKVVVAAEGFEPFKMKRDHLSPNYTTDWQSLLKVKC